MTRLLACVVSALLLAASAEATTLVITPTTNGAALAGALGGGGGLTITSATYVNGAASQVGTYTGFTSPPVTMPDGVVMSTGRVIDTTADSYSFLNFPSTNTGASGTAEFDAYGPGHIASFGDSNDVAALLVTFTLSSDAQVGFDFSFGSVEYPVFIGSFTDSFLAFLDGKGYRIKLFSTLPTTRFRSAPRSAMHSRQRIRIPHSRIRTACYNCKPLPPLFPRAPIRFASRSVT